MSGRPIRSGENGFCDGCEAARSACSETSAVARVLLIPPAEGLGSHVLAIATELAPSFEVKLGDYPPELKRIPGDLPVAALAGSLLETARKWFRPDCQSVLLGYSYGGRVAVELANCLAEGGIAVDLVVIGDIARELRPNFPGNERMIRREGRAAWQVARWIFRKLKYQLARNRFIRLLVPSPVLRWFYRALGGISAKAEMLRLALVFVLIERQLLSWRPTTYSGTVLLALTKPTIQANQDLPSDLGWATCCSQLLWQELPGDHHSFIKPPHVAHLQNAIRGALIVAQGRKRAAEG